METLENASRFDSASGRCRERLVDGLGRTALVAATALVGCLVLIGIGATMSVCWGIHPVLAVAAVAALGWAGPRLARVLLTTGCRTGAGVHHR